MGPRYSLIVSTPVEGCLQSILAQTVSDWECVVVGDAAPEQCDRIRFLPPSNGEPAEVRNQAAAAARGQRLVFLDGQAILHPQALEALDAGFATGAMVVWSHGEARTIDPFWDHLFGAPSPPVGLSEVALNRSCLSEVGGLKSLLFSDWEFWLRLACLYKVAVVEARISSPPPFRPQPGEIFGAVGQVLSEIAGWPGLAERLRQDPGEEIEFPRTLQARLLILECCEKAFHGEDAAAVEAFARASELCYANAELTSLYRYWLELLHKPGRSPLAELSANWKQIERLRPRLGRPYAKFLQKIYEDRPYLIARQLIEQGKRPDALTLAVYNLMHSRTYRSLKSFLRFSLEALR
jgi:glycosyltransferase involved in cell wall biosynthesis